MGPDACVKCHQAEVQHWQTTPHCQTFEELHRSSESKAIADRLDLKSVKRNDVCTQCHYTNQQSEGKDRIIAGISCESCHGAARNWIELHGNYGAPGATRESESPLHRRERREQSIAAGMNNPENLYLLARQCLACHTTPDERLVNVGGHRAGSDEFELVAWSQGLVRHNFLRGGGTHNQPSDPARLRVMYVVGVMADLEASLRATAVATEKAQFGVTAARRAARQKKRLYEIAQLVDNPLVRQALEAAVGAQLKLNNQDQLLAAADLVGQYAFEFAASADGHALAALDRLVPREDQFRWQSQGGQATAAR
jgi:hypothetical protein